MKMTRVMLGGCALPVLAFAFVVPALAQSTGSQQVEETVVVTGKAKKSTQGLIVQEKVPKSRSTVTQQYIKTQLAGQSVIQSLNLLPGVNFTNSDPYGSSGGNIRLRSFDGARISLTADGIPLNDTGNYATYTNQLFDPEIISQATVNLGTTDVDSPTASATGGTINVITRRPDEDPHLRMDASVGSFDFKRVFGMIDTGAFGPWGTTAWISASTQQYDKYKGAGDLEKQQYNAKVYQEIGDNGDFIAIAGHYNKNRNDFYRNLSSFVHTNADGTVSLGQIQFYGRDYDELSSCTRAHPTPGVADNDGATGAFDNTVYQTATDDPEYPGSCTNYYGLRINPSNTANVRIQSRFTIADNLHLTIDPSFQYTLADGGGTQTLSEKDGRIIGSSGLPGVDLNGDGDILDTVRFYAPSVTNTYRWGVNASLIYDLDEHNTLRIAYTLDYGRHHQTGEYGYIDADGNPQNVFGGQEGDKIYTADGSWVRGRDRFSVAKLNQFAASYNGSFLNDTLKIAAGLRLPFFERDLNQFCFSQDGSSNVRCTTEPYTVLPDGNVKFAGVSNEWIPPYTAEKKYNKILPNLGISYEFAPQNIVYASYAEGLSAPRTDNLYTPRRDQETGDIILTGVAPEKTNAYDLGYRFQGQQLTASTALWYIKYDNRIVNSFDDQLGEFIDRNVGTVDLWGVDAEAGYKITEEFSVYASASYIHSKLEDNISQGADQFLATKGKKLVETPDWTFAARAQYQIENFTLGVQGKYVGKRYATDVNDEVAQSYTTVDLDLRYDFAAFGLDGTYVQFNALNIFDRDYLGSVATSQTNALSTTLVDGNGSPILGTNGQRAGSAVLYTLGAPQTFQVTIGIKF